MNYHGYGNRPQESVLKPLLDALSKGKTPYAMLIEYGGKLDINQRDHNNMTPLRHVIKDGNLKAITVLLEMGADFVSSYPKCPNAIYAVIDKAPQEKKEAILRLLLDYQCIDVACCQGQDGKDANFFQHIVSKRLFSYSGCTSSLLVDLLCVYVSPLPPISPVVSSCSSVDPSPMFVLSFLQHLPVFSKKNDHSRNYDDKKAALHYSHVASFLHVLLAFFPLKVLLSLSYLDRNSGYSNGSGNSVENRGDSLFMLTCMKGVADIVNHLLFPPTPSSTVFFQVDEEATLVANVQEVKEDGSTPLYHAMMQGYTEIAGLVRRAKFGEERAKQLAAMDN